MSPFSDMLQSSRAGRYKFAGRMIGHTDAIHALALTKNGKYLASGGKPFRDIEEQADLTGAQGSDGVKIWNVKAHVQLACPKQGHIVRGQVSCVLWVTGHNDYETLCYGTGLGYLVFWWQNPCDVSALKPMLLWFDTTPGYL